jgi:hypothetical protein
LQNRTYNIVKFNFNNETLQDGDTKYLLNKIEITREAFDRMPDDKKKEVETLTFRQFEQLPDDKKKEVTLQVKFSKPAKAQLDLDLQVLTCLLKMIGLNDLPPIKRMVASPEELIDEELKKNLSDDGIDFFHADYAALKENSKLIENAANEAFQFKEEDYKRLIAALAFLSSVLKIKQDQKKTEKGLTEPEMILATQEGAVGRQVSENLQMQTAVKYSLPDSNHEQGTIVVWLDPIQQEIMNDKKTKKHIIIGPASTGKTILIQLKVLEIVTKTTNNKVLIILPCNQLKEKYKEFFQSNKVHTTGRVDYITSENTDWEHLLEANIDSHWFVDEFAALHAGQKELCDHIITKSK